MSFDTLPRRSVLFTLAATSLAAACSSSSSPASPDAGSPKDGATGGGAADAMLLNGLLADEYNAIATYAAAAPYLEKPDKSDPGAALAPVVLKVALHFSAQHTDHADALVTAIKAVGGTPVKQSTSKFTAPSGFTTTVTNIMKLAANAERAAAVIYNQTVAKLTATTNRLLAGAISGDEAQHFIVLYALLQGTAQPGSSLSTTTATDVVPAPFVAGVGIDTSLKDIADFDVTS